jgi:hypothetical protein
MKATRSGWFAFGWLMFQFVTSLANQAVAQTNSTNAGTLPARSFLGMGGISTTPERRASPKFVGTELPVPPQQNARWIPPANPFPVNYATATALLFAHGMADPRGCEYREIEIGTGEPWAGDGGVVATRGWVLPGSGAHRFAVAWNGLVYPVVNVGKAADLAVDVRAAAEKVGRNWAHALPELYTTSHETSLALKGCILFRLGEVELAKLIWSAAQLGQTLDLNRAPEAPKPDAQSVKLSDTDPYLVWASDWAWGAFDRAVCAHMRGDDGLSLASARLLATAQPKIEAAADRRGFERKPIYNLSGESKYLGHVGFLSPLPVLLADQERRARRKAPQASLTDIAKLPEPKARIASLIERLDDVAVRQWAQPGGLDSWDTDPVLGALLKEGKSAIDPLLEHLEQEAASRLTRSVSFGRDFRRGRTLHPTTSPVVQLLLNLMEASYAEAGVDYGTIAYGKISNADLAGRLRSYWESLGQMPRAERWYRNLADDKAGGKAWADALGNLIKTEPVPGKTNETRLMGEGLRTKTSPKVTDLLVRRAGALVGSASHAFERSEAVAFLVNAEKWEAAPLLPLATDFQQSIALAYAGKDNVGSADPLNAKAIAALALLRARHGDTKGLDAYALWISQALPAVLDDSVLDVLEPFWQFPKHPSLRTAAAGMFGTPTSPWGTLAWMLDSRSQLGSRKPLATPVLIIPEIRALVLDELRNLAPGGEAENRGGGNLSVRYANGRSVGYGGRKDTEGLAIGAKFPFRRCDVVLEQLTAIPGFPAFSILWSEPKRDEAVTAAVALLKDSGERLRVRPMPRGWSSAFDPPLVELGK